MRELSSLIRHNLLAKILALVVSSVMWIFVMNDQNPIINSTVTVPVRMVNVPENHLVMQEEADVRLKVRASRSLLASYNVDDFDAYVDLSRAVEGENVVKITTIVPSGFELLDMSDETMKVVLDQVVERYVDVEVSTAGTMAPNTVLDEINLEVNKILVGGPRSIVDRVYEVEGSVDVSEKRESFRAGVNLLPVDKSGLEVDGVSIDRNNIQVSVNVSKAKQKKMVPLHLVSTGDLPAGLVLSSVKVEPQKVEISAEENLIANIETVNTQPVELSKVTGNTVETVGLQLPEGVSANVDTVQVTVDVSAVKVDSQ